MCVYIYIYIYRCASPFPRSKWTQNRGSHHRGLHMCKLGRLPASSAKAKGPRDTRVAAPARQRNSKQDAGAAGAKPLHLYPRWHTRQSRPRSPNQRKVNRMPPHTSWHLSAWLGVGLPACPPPAHFLQLGPWGMAPACCWHAPQEQP